MMLACGHEAAASQPRTTFTREIHIQASGEFLTAKLGIFADLYGGADPW